MPTQESAHVIGGRYLLGRLIGQGGMGGVYRAEDRLTDETVALKQIAYSSHDLLFNSRADYTDLNLALANEFQVLASLRHPNIIGVLDYGFDRTVTPYFTMRLLEDAAIITSAAREGDTVYRAGLLIQLLQALAYLHRCGILHRDLKPSNILVQPQGAPTVKVLDFGIAIDHGAAQPESGAVGTLAYTAPELISRSHTPSRASDLYAVGVIAYELFTGRHPFNTTSRAFLAQDILHREPDFTPLDPRLHPVMARLLEKDPSRRFEDAGSLIHAFCTALTIDPPTETAWLRESYLQAAPFIGREAELNRLTDALRGAEDGSGSLWLVGGESGVGKSRLLRELRTRALVSGVRVLQGQAAVEGGLPNQVWRGVLPALILQASLTDFEAQVLKAVVPHIGGILRRPVDDAPPLDGVAAQQRLALTIRDVFRRLSQPVLLILEDLQWARDGLDILELLSERVDDQRLLIVGTYRSDETPDLPDEFPTAHHLPLARLSDTSVAALSTAMLGDLGQRDDVLRLLTRETEGNTFFMVEVVRALAEAAGALTAVGTAPLPETVMPGGMRQLLRRRLNRVPDWGQQALKLAAVAGRQIDLRVMQATRQEVPWDRWLTDCLNAAVFEVSGDDWRFAHDKLREAALAELDDETRRRLHRGIAEALETVYPDDAAYAPRLAEHWYVIGDLDKTLHYTLHAADQIINVTLDYPYARRLLERGVSLTEPHKQDPRYQAYYADFAIALGKLLSNQFAQMDEGLQYLELGLRETEDNPASHAQAYDGLSMVYTRTGSYVTALDYASKAFELAEIADDDDLRRLALNQLGNISLYQLEYEQAKTYLQAAVDIQRRNGTLEADLAPLFNLRKIETDFFGNHSAARPGIEEVLEIQRHSGNRWTALTTTVNLAILELMDGCYDQAYRYYTECIAEARELGKAEVISYALIGLGYLAIQTGALDKVQGYIDEIIEITTAAQLFAFRVQAYIVGGQWQYVLGNYDAARDYFNQAYDALAPLQVKRVIAQTAVSMGDLLFIMGDYEGARQQYQTCCEIFETFPGKERYAQAVAGLARVDWGLGRWDDACAELIHAVETARPIPNVSALLYPLIAAIYLACHHGLSDQANEWAGCISAQRTFNTLHRKALERVMPYLDPASAAWQRGAHHALQEAAAAVLHTFKDSATVPQS